MKRKRKPAPGKLPSGKPRAQLKNGFGAKAKPWIPWYSHRRDWQHALAGQSGDLQGLSSLEGADSESVDELLEEGNAFEAEAVKGVQDAGDADEVHTHEVPEDDVPGEYRDKDK